VFWRSFMEGLQKAKKEFYKEVGCRKGKEAVATSRGNNGYLK
jgi:hypothetical protein